jgi:nanoRNase/pAp phosphatase (c-di-AMP/oligoRNAs hydrolase)
MRVNVLHHAACFDGAASSAIFTAVYQSCTEAKAEFVYIPKAHKRGDPFEPSDFDADDSAIVDFRYSANEKLGWFFDHHKSAFQIKGEYEHFLADASGKKFHDPTAPSCTGYIAMIGEQKFGFDPKPHRELLHWAEIIDTASFPNPTVPVELEEPAMRLMTFVEQNRNASYVQRFIEDLLTVPLEKLAREPYVQSVVQPALELHRRDIELMRERCEVTDGVASYDLSDQPPRAYNKFIAYYLHPEVRYLVGISRGPEGRIKLSAGYNPWLPASEREHDIAALCEKFDGGGHPYVGGVSFRADDGENAAEAQAFIAEVLRGERAP